MDKGYSPFDGIDIIPLSRVTLTHFLDQKMLSTTTTYQ